MNENLKRAAELLDEVKALIAGEASIPMEYAAPLHLDNETDYERAKRLNKLLAAHRHVVLTVGEGQEVPGPVAFGGTSTTALKPQQGASVIIEGAAASQSTVHGITLFPDADFTLRLEQLTLRPAYGGMKFALGSVGMTLNASVYTDRVRVAGTEGSEQYKGFGALWGILMQGGALTLRNTLIEPMGEHGVYGLNLRDFHANGVTNTLVRRKDATGTLQPLGMGRTLIQLQNRIPTLKSSGTIGGPCSMGTATFENVIARRCGHEGFLQGHTAIGGGSDITVGGWRGRVIMDHVHSVRPWAGSIAVWAERHNDEADLDTNPHGYRCWFGEKSEVWHEYKINSVYRDTGWATRRLDIRDFEVTQPHNPNWPAVQLSSIEEGRVELPPGIAPVVDYQPYLTQSGVQVDVN